MLASRPIQLPSPLECLSYKWHDDVNGFSVLYWSPTYHSFCHPLSFSLSIYFTHLSIGYVRCSSISHFYYSPHSIFSLYFTVFFPQWLIIFVSSLPIFLSIYLCFQKVFSSLYQLPHTILSPKVLLWYPWTISNSIKAIHTKSQKYPHCLLINTHSPS